MINPAFKEAAQAKIEKDEREKSERFAAIAMRIKDEDNEREQAKRLIKF